MTIKKRLARSNLAMFVIPVLAAAVVLAFGFGAALVLLDRIYLPRLGLTLYDLNRTGEQIEDIFFEFKAFLCIYAGAVAAALVLTIVLTNVYLTRRLFRHISDPLDALTAGVARIRDGDLDAPIAYAEPDEFKSACDSVDEMAARLRASLEQQQSEQQKKQEMIAGISHDIKSPLTSIRAYTEALLDGVAENEETKRHYLQTIYAKESDIEAMVNRLFAFTKMDMRGYPIRMERLPLREALEEAAAEQDADGVTIELNGVSTLTVLADRELLRRIAENLLDNSRKYGGEKVHVTISARERIGFAEVSFADDGAGVAEEQLPKLFDVFYRGDAARTMPGSGSGLGLAVVKKAVEEMGGSVRAENVETGGLRVIFTLPLTKEENDA